jgi:hypothetical protein
VNVELPTAVNVCTRYVMSSTTVVEVVPPVAEVGIGFASVIG